MSCKIIPKKYLFWSLCAFCLSLFSVAFLPSSSANALTEQTHSVYINYSDLPLTLDVFHYTDSSNGFTIYYENDDDFLGKTLDYKLEFSNIPVPSVITLNDSYIIRSSAGANNNFTISYPDRTDYYSNPFTFSVDFPDSRNNLNFIPQRVYLRFWTFNDSSSATLTISEHIDEPCPLCPVIPTNPYDQKLDNIYHAILYCGASLLVICIYLSIYKIYQRVRRY